MDFIRSAKAAGDPFYVNIWLHVSHDRLDPTEAQKDAATSARCASLRVCSVLYSNVWYVVSWIHITIQYL